MMRSWLPDGRHRGRAREKGKGKEKAFGGTKMFWIGFIVGILAGVILGLLASGLCQMASGKTQEN